MYFLCDYSGGTSDKSSLHIDLTILSEVSPEDPVMQEEIFGPILPIINVNSASEAIEFINAREKPLTLYLFSEGKYIQGLLFVNCQKQIHFMFQIKAFKKHS